MKNWYLSTFKSFDGKYYTNLVLTDSEEKAEEHYSKYDMVSIPGQPHEKITEIC